MSICRECPARELGKAVINGLCYNPNDPEDVSAMREANPTAVPILDSVLSVARKPSSRCAILRGVIPTEQETLRHHPFGACPLVAAAGLIAPKEELAELADRFSGMDYRASCSTGAKSSRRTCP